MVREELEKMLNIINFFNNNNMTIFFFNDLTHTSL